MAYFVYNFSLFFRLISNVFINIHEYANYIACILDNNLRGPCHNIYLVPNFVEKDNIQLRYS